MNSPPVVIVIPAYNEERFIGSVLLKLRHYPAIIVVVDDGSSDDTARIAQDAGALVIRHPCNRGKGAALATGLHLARQLDPCAVVLIDGDGQHLPEQLPLLLDPILTGEADLVVGSRYLEPRPSVPTDRRLAHRLLNRIIAGASSLSLTDSQSGYRALSPRACAQDLFLSPGFAVESEMQFWAHEHGLRVKEVRITVRYPDPPKRSPWRQGLAVITGVLRLTGQYRPLLCFAAPGSVLLLIGIAAGCGAAQRYSLTGEMDTGTALLAILASLIGLVMLSTGFILHSVRGLLFDMLHSHLKDTDQNIRETLTG